MELATKVEAAEQDKEHQFALMKEKLELVTTVNCLRPISDQLLH